MKICVNALQIEPGITGGGETFLVNLMKQIARLDGANRYLILVTEENRHLFADNPSRIHCRTILRSSRSKLSRLLFENLILPFFLLWYRVDLYYSPSGVLPLILFCRSVVTFQNLIYLDFDHNVTYRGNTLRSRLAITLQGWYYRFLTPLSLRQADGIWTVSQTCAAQLTDRYQVSPNRIETIYEGVELGQFNPARRDHGPVSHLQTPYIVTVATLYPNKNIDKLIMAFSAVVANGFPHQLIIVGPDWRGYRNVLQAHADILGLSRRVVFTGAVPHKQIPEYLWDADLFVLMSSVEAFGLPVIEAMATGVPVIVSDTSALPEIAGDAAITTPPGTPSRLAKEMIRVLSDRDLAHEMRERGMNRARRFDWTETAARAVDLFNRVGRAPNAQETENEGHRAVGHKSVVS